MHLVFAADDFVETVHVHEPVSDASSALLIDERLKANSTSFETADTFVVRLQESVLALAKRLFLE